MPNDINVQQLIINKLTKSKYNELKNANSLEPNQLYIISDDFHYTEAEILELLKAKQNVLTAEGRLNIIDNTITVDLSDFYTINDLTPLLNNKADIDKTGNKLLFENNTIYLKDINDNIISQVTIDAKADVHVDNKTTILNDNHEVQVIGETTKNNITKYTWIGTTQEYNEALASKLIDENTECLITDDEQNLTPVVNFKAPTKLSELANDTNFVNNTDLDNVKIDLETQINNKLQDSSFVHTTGNEVIDGVKDFKQDIVIRNNLKNGKISHKENDSVLADGYIEFGDNTLIYGKEDISSEVEAKSRKNIFHEGNLTAGNNITIIKENDIYKINSSGSSGDASANKDLSNLNSKGEKRFNDKANTSLDNLTQEGENKFANKANISLSNLTEAGKQIIKDNASGGQIIGQTIFSLDPLYEAGIHLFDGALIEKTGIYKDFYNTYLTKLKASHPERFITEEAWQESVSQYGVCGKYVDGVDTFRLPKVTGIVEGTLDVRALGDVVEAGLPNITGTFSACTDKFIQTGAFKITNRTDTAASGTRYNLDSWYSFDASKASPIYGASDTVQPQTTKGYLYLVISNSTKTQIEVDIDNVVTDLNGKADTNLSNSTVPHIIEAFVSSNAQSGYNIYSNGFCIQWGYGASSITSSVSLLKAYKDELSYTVLLTMSTPSALSISVGAKTSNSFRIYKQNAKEAFQFFTIGYIT